MPSQIAAQMYTLRNFCTTLDDTARALDRLRQIGYEAVQMSGLGDWNAPALARMLQQSGLVCCSTHLGWDSFANNLPKVIDDHRLWGCKHPAIGGMPKDFRTAEGVVQFAELATAAGRKLAQAGMDWSYHNHNFEFVKIGRKTMLETFYELTDPACVKAEIDTYWVTAGGGDPAAWITRYAGRMPILHLKDMVFGPDGKQRFAEVGEGNLNWPAILAAARQAGVEWYCVEQDECYGRDQFESLKISLDNLRGMGLR